MLRGVLRKKIWSDLFDNKSRTIQVVIIISIGSLAVGVFFAFVAAMLSVKWMVGYLQRHGLAIFGYYRVGLALVAGVMLMSGAL